MKRIFAVFAAVLLGGFGLVAAGPRDDLWKQVDDAVKKGLPKTAITNLEPIIQGALRDKAYAEATKAIGRKITLEGAIQGSKPEEKITRLEAEIARAPAPMKPLLQTVMAHWYWQYFEQNRWRFVRRTQTGEPPGADFTTWDLPRLFTEIDRHFQAALAAEQVLQATPIGDWNDLLEKGTMPDEERPTLYDFIAHEALAFYTSGEQAGARPEDAAELSLEGWWPHIPPPLAPAAEFLTMPPGNRIQSTAQIAEEQTLLASAPAKASAVFVKLLRFHQNDPAPQTAFAAADLERLTWAWNTVVSDDKNARYLAALELFISRHAESPVSALALEREARLLNQEGDPARAHELAASGFKLFPKSPGGRLCHNLLIEIEAKSVAISTERVWNSPWPELTIHYRNVDQVHFRAIPVDWELFLQKQHSRPENLNETERREILARKSALEWSESLPPTADFKEKSFSNPAPKNLKPGFYFIAASPDPKFGEKDNVITMRDVWVSDLALVTRARDGNIEGFVLEAESGEPVSGAEVSVWHLDNAGNRIADPQLTSDADGFFQLTLAEGERHGYLFRARKNGQEIASAQDIWWYQSPHRPAPASYQRTIFFTDRALYRPGQTIQFKGICLRVDASQDNYDTLKGESVTVVFRDVNGKEIVKQQMRANDYGSFSGSFTAPRDRLMGQMTLSVDSGAPGQAYFRVEEYKRPKFEVTLDAPKVAARLNEHVSLTGHATSYTGAAVDGALVTFHVVREVRMPWWWWGWRRGGFGGQSQEIAHGTARTGSDGAVTIEFTAKPDLKVAATNEPTFNFAINVDVTDGAGETRSASRDIRVGYTALEAMMTADAWQSEGHPVALKIDTKTLDGEPQAAAGTIKIHQLQPPEKVHRAELTQEYWPAGQPGAEGTNDLSNPANWPLGRLVQELPFATGTNGTANLSLKLGAGEYRAELETKDRFGKKVTGRLQVRVVNPEATKLDLKIPQLFAAPKWEAQPGDEFMALWGTGYEPGRAFIEIENRQQMIRHFWTTPGRTQEPIKLAVTEALRGGFTLHVTQIRENRAYLESRRVDVPWKNKVLELKWEHFTSKLRPGAKETWTAVVTGPGAEKATAEMVATLYDESLDAFAAQNWPGGFGVFRQDFATMQPQFANFAGQFNRALGGWERAPEYVEVTWRHFPPDFVRNLRRYAPGGFGGGGIATRGGREGFMSDSFSTLDASAMRAPAMATPIPAAVFKLGVEAEGKADRLSSDKNVNGLFDARAGVGGAVAVGRTHADLSQVTARKNLNETAFFFPQLMSDTNGVVRMTFTMPEALTKWHLLAFAHDQKLRGGLLDAHTVTAKEIMVQPNPPRFLREGDTVEFTVKVSNQSDQPQQGQVRLTFGEVATERSADKLLGNLKTDRDFDIPAKESRSFFWRITVPDGTPFLSFKAVASTSALSDGEEGGLPVLSRRVFITESLPLPIRGPGTAKFVFTKLAESGKSKTIQNESLQVQMVSNPAWYAVLALPYLMEYPYECAEQTFNRLYANSLARHIATSDPKIRAVFDQWKNTPALESPLEKNQDLKSVMVEETPWYRQARSESEARRNVGILFDGNRLDVETDAAWHKLAEMQLADGRWPWFPGGPANDYITLYIVTGFGRLRHLGAELDVQPALRSLARLDQWMTDHYDEIQLHYPKPQEYVPSATDALYLYGRSFFLKDVPIAPRHAKAVTFFLEQSRKYWLQTNCRQTQGQLALALTRWGGTDKLATAKDIMRSIKEHSVSDGELGMFWRDTELSWWWYRAPIETQALMIEAFDEVMNDQPTVEDCKVWLLKQKQTQDWKTTKATADAVYALLLRGANLLASTALTEVTIGGINVTPGKNPRPAQNPKSEMRSQPEPGTGFYEVHFAPADIKPKMGQITVMKPDAGVAWGAVHWQYFEDIGKVTPYAGTPLKLKKTLFTRVNSAKGPVLQPVKGPLAVGDELVVRIELRTDRDMEFVHLKDQRGSGIEPVNVLSHYKYQDGLGYYESTRDTASHFFMDYVPKGVYVFEYATRVQLRGNYQTGVAEIQCLYAPEFNSHSESLPLVVK